MSIVIFSSFLRWNFFFYSHANVNHAIHFFLHFPIIISSFPPPDEKTQIPTVSDLNSTLMSIIKNIYFFFHFLLLILLNCAALLHYESIVVFFSSSLSCLVLLPNVINTKWIFLKFLSKLFNSCSLLIFMRICESGKFENCSFRLMINSKILIVSHKNYFVQLVNHLNVNSINSLSI